MTNLLQMALSDMTLSGAEEIEQHRAFVIGSSKIVCHGTISFLELVKTRPLKVLFAKLPLAY